LVPQVQRPGCEEIISVDLYVLRWYAGLINKILSLLKRDIDVIAVIDDFGELIYR
jgi:predicted unusual protein kinase regulating ubiquinone biosynthesis (AarF/ABC1/UbiB family)